MSTFIIRRILEAVPVVIGVSILVFLLIHLIPGDPAVAMLGERASDDNVEAIRERLGLNKPLPEQYFIWAGNMLRGDLGNTVRGNIPINQELRNRLPATAELSMVALTLATLIGVPIGIISAVRRNSFIDTATMIGALIGVSIPIFVLGLLLIFLVGVEFRWLPFVGRLDSTIELNRVTGILVLDSIITSNWEAFRNAVEHLILPSITLMTIPLAIIARITRSTMLEVLNQDYIRTAHAKGLSRMRVIIGHALRNALIPVITMIGLEFGFLLSGVVVVETVFSWPGVGRLVFNSINQRDIPVVQSAVVMFSLLFVFLNLIVDLLYVQLNPRVRLI